MDRIFVALMRNEGQPETTYGELSLEPKNAKTGPPRGQEFIVKIRRWAPFGKNIKKKLFQIMCVFLMKVDFAMLSRALERGDPDQLRSLRVARQGPRILRALK